MIAEVISVGTELLLGQVVNSNASTIADRLAATGYDAHFQVTVGDNLDRIVEVLSTACSRADVVVVTGGIGPTPDDVTKEAVCMVGGVAVGRDDEHAARIHSRVMEQRGVVLDSVLRMADVPGDAEPLPNGNGLALGAALDVAGARIFVLPGVPKEMGLMLDEQVVPRLIALSGGAVVRSEVVRTRGLGESEVADRLDALFASQNPSIAFQVTDTSVRVRITGKAASAVAAEELVMEMTSKVAALLGDALVD